MNFTREPIIETIITPKDGYKLVVRSSKTGSGAEFAVDAVEVVSFGNALFFRSQERPKAFLVPVSDFEIVESKETRVVLKNTSFEGSIKIGGGKEGSMKASKEKEEEPEQVEQRLEKKRERRRHRRRREVAKEEAEQPQPATQKVATEGGGAKDEAVASSSPVTRLIPPPSGLISDKISRAREEVAKETEGNVLSEQQVIAKKGVKDVVEDPPPKRGRRKKQADRVLDEKQKENSNVEQPAAPEDTPHSHDDKGGEVSRSSLPKEEAATSTSFSSLDSQEGTFF